MREYYVITYGRVHEKDGSYICNVGVAYDHSFVMQQADDNGRVDYTVHHSNEAAELCWREHCREMGKRWPLKAGVELVQRQKYEAITRGERLVMDSPSKADEQKPKNLFDQ